jgi:DNA-directed RNA polymerase subunit N (RpoN/RPB10)
MAQSPVRCLCCGDLLLDLVTDFETYIKQHKEFEYKEESCNPVFEELWPNKQLLLCCRGQILTWLNTARLAHYSTSFTHSTKK